MDHTPNPDYPDGYPDWTPGGEQVNAAIMALVEVEGLYLMLPEGSRQQARAKEILDALQKFAAEEGWWQE